MSFDKKKSLTKCPHCGKDIDISNCGYVQKLMVQYKTQKEIAQKQAKHHGETLRSKNGTIQALHQHVGKLLDLMTPEQREHAKEIHQKFRDEIRKWEKKKI